MAPRSVTSWAQLGARIAQARKTAGLTQEQLTQEIGLERSAVSKIESGGRELGALELGRVAQALKRPVHWFVSVPSPSLSSRRSSLAGRAPHAIDDLLEDAGAAEKGSGATRTRSGRPGRPRSLLFNYHRVRQRFREGIALVEDPWSVMRFAQAGLPAIALMGTTLSPRQSDMLQPGSTVLLILDGAPPRGQAAPQEGPGPRSCSGSGTSASRRAESGGPWSVTAVILRRGAAT